MKTSEIMTRAVVTVTPETTIAEAAALMLERRISGLPVVGTGGGVVGVLTEGDLLRRAETGTDARRSHWLELLLGPGRMAEGYTRAHARKVGEVMSEDVVSVTPETDLAEVAKLMERRRLKRLPVIDNGRLVGIVSRADLVRAVLNALAQPAAATLSDDQIREAILDQIAAEPWGPRFGIEVTVTNGSVKLTGTVTDERERIAARVLAENVPSVKAVRDEIVWVDPISGIVIPAEAS